MPIEMNFHGATVQFLHGEGIEQNTGERHPAMQMRVVDPQSGIICVFNWVGAELENVMSQLKSSANIAVVQTLPDELRKGPNG